MTRRAQFSSAIVFAFLLNLSSCTNAPESDFKHVVVDDSGPRDMHVKSTGDLNGDGFIDLIVAGTGGGLVWYEYPTWGKHVISMGGGRWSTDAEVGDIDRDGDQDIVISDWYHENRLVWFENPGLTGTWTLHVIGSPRAHDIELGDLDGDGDQDIMTRQQGVAGNRIEIWIQNKPTSWTHLTFNCPDGEGLTAADLDKDGDPDVVIAARWYETPDDILAGSWKEHIYSSGWTHKPVVVKTGDMNKDGRTDIVITPAEPRGGSYRTAWFEAPADPKSPEWTEHVIDSSIETVTHSLGIADMNSDGNPDVVTAEMHQGSNPDEVRIYINGGAGITWVKHVISRRGSHNLRIADVGNDGDFDLFGANWSKTGQVDLWENLTNPYRPGGKLWLNKWSYIQVDDSRSHRAFGLALGDLTGDGYGDIVSGQYFYRNPGGDMLDMWSRVTFPDSVDAVLIVNVDGDALGDVIGLKLPDVYWLEATDTNGTGWKATKIGTIPSTPHGNSQGYALSQIIDNDRPEVILAGGDGIYYFQIPKDPSADLWRRTQITPRASEEGIGTGDIDRDGDIDICAGVKKGTGRVAWWENPGNGAGNWTTHEIGTMPDKYADRFCTSDLNGDGRLDIIVSAANGSKNGAFWWEQPDDPKSSNWKLHTVALQETTNSMDAADIDNDGDIDIISGEHRGAKKVTIWENVNRASSWVEHIVSKGRESHLGTRVADLDGDGDLDIVSIAWDDFQYLHLWRNDAATGGSSKPN